MLLSMVHLTNLSTELIVPVLYNLTSANKPIGLWEIAGGRRVQTSLAPTKHANYQHQSILKVAERFATSNGLIIQSTFANIRSSYYRIIDISWLLWYEVVIYCFSCGILGTLSVFSLACMSRYRHSSPALYHATHGITSSFLPTPSSFPQGYSAIHRLYLASHIWDIF